MGIARLSRPSCGPFSMPGVQCRPISLIAEASKAAGSGEYRLVNRYFEATPPPVLTAALDGFGAFVVKPDTYQKVLTDIQAAADEDWSTHQQGN
jgi:multiple sugar transport system substrate-binding protein